MIKRTHVVALMSVAVLADVVASEAAGGFSNRTDRVHGDPPGRERHREIPNPDVGNAVALFCSKEAGWITGQLVAADGGMGLMDAAVPLTIQLPELQPA